MKQPTAWDNFLYDVEDWIDDHMGWIVAVLLGGLLFLGHHVDAHAHPLEAIHMHVDVGREKVKPEYENHNLLLKVNWFDTEKELQETLTARGEEDFSDTAAYSECEVHYEDDDDIGFCEIWVVRPIEVDDDHFISMGHEVLHGVLGDYHAP